MNAVRAAAFFLLVLGLLAGCSGGPVVGDVSGTVSFDGKPVEIGSISFISADGSKPSAGGAIADGKYSVSNVPAGPTKVRISGVKVTGKKKMYDDPGSPVVETSVEALPPKYSDDKLTELRYDVQSGAQTKNFDLTK